MRSERSALLNGHLFLWWDFWNQDVDSVDFIIFRVHSTFHLSIICLLSVHIYEWGGVHHVPAGAECEMCVRLGACPSSHCWAAFVASLWHIFLTNIELSAALCKRGLVPLMALKPAGDVCIHHQTVRGNTSKALPHMMDDEIMPVMATKWKGWAQSRLNVPAALIKMIKLFTVFVARE